jgi:uncharacterized protein YceH (UPF0502 family)
MATFDSLTETEAAVASLCERGLARRLARRPGQKEDRFEHLLGSGEDSEGPAEPATVAVGDEVSAPTANAAKPDESGVLARVAALEGEVAALRSELAALRAAADGAGRS